MANSTFKSELIFDKLGQALFRCELLRDGKVSVKNLGFDDYLKLLDDSRETDLQYQPIGTIPEHYFAGEIGQMNSFKVVLVYPGQKRALAYGGEHFYISFPAVAFYFEYRRGTRKEAKCFALSSDAPTSGSLLYHYPFGNVGNGGGICFGNIHLPQVNCMADTEKVVDCFFDSITNTDLYHSQNSAGLSQGELITYVSKRKKYPKNMLVSTNSTINDLFKLN